MIENTIQTFFLLETQEIWKSVSNERPSAWLHLEIFTKLKMNIILIFCSAVCSEADININLMKAENIFQQIKFGFLKFN